MIATDPSANEETEFNSSHKATEEVVGEDANSGSLAPCSSPLVYQILDECLWGAAQRAIGK